MSRHFGIRVLRLVAAVALLVAVAGFFRQPLVHVVFPGVEKWAAEAGLADAAGLGPAPGFLLQARSVPPGALLVVDDEPRGPLPFLGNVVCRNGDEVTLEARLEGYETWARTVECRDGGRLQVTARLTARLRP